MSVLETYWTETGFILLKQKSALIQCSHPNKSTLHLLTELGPRTTDRKFLQESILVTSQHWASIPLQIPNTDYSRDSFNQKQKQKHSKQTLPEPPRLKEPSAVIQQTVSNLKQQGLLMGMPEWPHGKICPWRLKDLTYRRELLTLNFGWQRIFSKRRIFFFVFS